MATADERPAGAQQDELPRWTKVPGTAAGPTRYSGSIGQPTPGLHRWAVVAAMPREAHHEA